MTDPAPPALATVGTTEIAAPPELALPERIGRYRVEKILGQGGFGLVYLARDEELQRPVAIKVPHRKLVARPEDAAAYLTEARTVANLDHAHIVPVHDVGSTPEFPCFVVSKYIDGTDLAKQLAQSRPSLRETVEVVATVAEALHYAHKQGLVHRDVKPGNILLDRSGKPFITDFGIALREQDVGKGHEFAGTPAYMSPEQARGEGHRVDGRSDIFSLGVMFYELLTGRSPFRSETLDALLLEITNTDPKPPRMIDDTIPKELERVCLKALSRRATERYTTARDLADDLRHFLSESPDLASPPIPRLPLTASQKLSDTAESAASPLATTPPLTDRQPLKIVPKGLRSFDANDADFFLELLPGPRDRDGLPDSIRFWKTRIESTDPDSTFAVGLIYGPSGCGKSSLVKAGLLPRLTRSIKTVYIEATGDDTELRLLKGLRRQLPDLPDNLGLVDTLAALRRGRHLERDEKVLLVLDQFEQWLHSHRHEALTELVQALRHCDGVRLQAIVMVRDDFWMAATRFMSELEIRLVEGQNSAAADLFPVRHAEKVLALFGRAYGELPPNPAQDTKEQQQFVQAAVTGLAQDGKVICVRVALFADMVKGKPWTPATLKAIGGTEGVGVTFLEETFAAKSAPPQHRLHQQAAQAVLKSLLPEAGTDIKGHMRSQQELVEASGYASRPRDFDELLRILDSELRLITPTDPAGQDASSEPGGGSPRSPETRYYQLTHDYLVPSLRDWLTRKQKETRRGRAELLLAERTAMWHAKPEARQLPSVVQWLQIRWLTPRKQWTPAQRKLMSRAGRYHAVRSAAVGVFLAVAAVAGLAIRDRVDQQKRATHAAGLVQALLKADTAQVPAIVAELGEYRQWTDPLLKAEFDKSGAESTEKLHTSLGLLPVDPSQVNYLSARLLDAAPPEVPVIQQALQPHHDQLSQKLWSIVESPEKDKPWQRLRAAAALASYEPEQAAWQTLQAPVANDLVTVPAVYLSNWLEALRPVRTRLIPQLTAIYKDPARRETERSLATDILADYAADQPDILADLLLEGEASQFTVLLPKFQSLGAAGMPLVEAGRASATIASLSTIARTLPPDELGSVDRIGFGQRRANAAVTLLRLGEREKVLPVFEWTDDPEALTQFLFRCRPRGVGADALLDCLELVSAAKDRYPPHTRYALLLALGEFTLPEIPEERRNGLLTQLADWYANDASSGVHGAAGWLLRQWGQTAAVAKIDQTPVPYSPEREWFTLAITVKPTSPPESEPAPPQTFYYTFVVFPAGAYGMGSPADEPERQKDEVRHPVMMSRPFALLDREVTFQELIAFSPSYAGYMQKFDARTQDAAFAADWYDSVGFCRWLSEQSGLLESEQAYAAPESLDSEKYPREPNPSANWAPRDWPIDLNRRGFRLPTEAEWEASSRAGARTAYGYGSEVSLLGRFGWFVENSGKHVHPPKELRPSVRGAFDLHGNLFEWTHDWYGDFEVDAVTDPVGPQRGSNRVYRGGSWGLDAAHCRAAFRSAIDPPYRSNGSGIRLALSPFGASSPAELRKAK